MRNRVTRTRGRREEERRRSRKASEGGGRGRLRRMGKARAAQKLLNLIRLCRIAVQERREGRWGWRREDENGAGMGWPRGREGVDFTWGWWSRETPARLVWVSNWHRYRRGIYGLWRRATVDSRSLAIRATRFVRYRAPCLCWTYIVLNIIVKVRSCTGITTVSTIYVIVARQGVLSHRRTATRWLR